MKRYAVLGLPHFGRSSNMMGHALLGQHELAIAARIHAFIRGLLSLDFEHVWVHDRWRCG